MVRLLATLGTSPGPVYETLLNLCRGSYEAPYTPRIRVETVTLVHTSNPAVKDAYHAAKLLILCSHTLFPEGDDRRLPGECLPREVSSLPLEIDDVASRSEYEEFVKKIQSVVGPGDIVDISGGRVAMAVAAAMYASSMPGTMVVASAVPSDAYRSLSNVFATLRQKHSLGKLVEAVEEKGCKALIGTGADKLFAQLVTGKARTYALHP